MARIDRRVTRGEQRQERGLRPVEDEGRLEVAVDRDLLQIVPPDRARVLAEVVGVLAGQLVPGALHVLGGEGLAVVPLDAGMQLEGELGLGRVPGPAVGEVGNDGLGRVERLLLVVDDEVVEDAHERLDGGDRGLLVDGSAGKIVAVVDAQRAALLLRHGRQRDAGCRKRQRDDEDELRAHACPPGSPAGFEPAAAFFLGSWQYARRGVRRRQQAFRPRMSRGQA